jgi:hypothetical protein
MNLFGIIGLVVTLGLIVWFMGGQIEGIKQENSTEAVYSNTIDAAKNAADLLEK